MRLLSLYIVLLLTAAAQIPPITANPVDAVVLRYADVSAGDGPAAKPGQEYTVHYTGYLTDGTRFESSLDTKEPIVFVQGRRQVIAGWDLGFEGMKVGGKRRLFIPQQMAYGEKGSGPIPPRATLIFDVQLLAVKDVPTVLPAEDLLFGLHEYRDKVVALAKAIPAEKYGWRPGPGVRSIGEVLTHIGNGNRLLLDVASGDVAKDKVIAEIESNQKLETSGLTKDQIIDRLAQSFAAVEKMMSEARYGGLTHDVDYFGHAQSRRSILVTLDAHVAEHLGQLVAYARMNGIVPPWSS